MRAVHFKRRLEHGRGVIFLHDINEQPCLTVFLDEPIARGIVAPDSGEPRQHFVELLRIDRLALKTFHVASDVGRFMRVGAFDFDELRRGNIAALPRFAYLLMFLPACIVESKRFEQGRSRISGFVTALHDLRTPRVIHCAVLGERHGDDCVRLRQAAQFVLFQHYTHGMIQHAEHGLDVFCVDRR